MVKANKRKGFGGDMVEITYSYYKDEFKGSLVNENEFSRLLETAKIYVSNRTFGSSDSVDETHPYASRIKFTLCSVIELIKVHTSDDGTEHGAVTSESVGGSWSRSFKVDSKRGNTLDDIVYDKIYSLLSNTGLLYGGAFL